MLWAERDDRIFLTVEVSDSKEPKVDITDDGVVSVSATGGSEGVQYALKLELLHPVNAKARRESPVCACLRRYACLRRGADGWVARGSARRSPRLR